MRKLKIVITVTFLIFGLTLYSQRYSASEASQRIGGDSLAAPTGLIASDGAYSDKVGLSWDPVQYATRYRIFRNTSNNSSTSTEIGSTAASYFFDQSAAASQFYYYWIRAESGTDIGAFSSSDQGMMASGQIVPGVFSPLVPSPIPTGNETTAAKAYLGKVLFWDEQLSSTDTVACGSCHRPAAGGSDPRTVVGSSRSRNPGVDNVFNTADDVFGSPGVIRNNSDGTYFSDPVFGLKEQVTPRRSPTYINAGYGRGGTFWDGRADEVFRDPLGNAVLLDSFATLESQSVVPPLSSAEMAHGGRTWTQAAQKIAGVKPLALAVNIPPALQSWIGGRTYPQLFQEVYGTPEVTPARVAMAIAAHERSIFSDQAPLDKWAYGIEGLTPQEENGRQLFETLPCSSCHGGPLLSDQSFHNIGVRPQNEDLGRGAITGRTGDNGRFKTPTLRNVELRAPYMHNGRFERLEDVIDFYNRGGDFDAPNINHGLIHPLNLTPQQKADLVAFLKRPLTDDRVRNELPPFDRPTLYTESNRMPVISGSGRAGAGALVPEPIAIEPPFVGNPSFTVGVSNAVGGASAVLVIDSADPGVGGSIPTTGSFAQVELSLAGSGNGNGNGSVSLQIPNSAALIGQTFYGRWYVVDPAASNGFSVSRLFSFTVFGEAVLSRRTPFDFDGDQKTDFAVFRPNPNAEWWLINSSNSTVFAAAFGSSSDTPVPADFTGDGKTDIAFFRPSTGTWFVLRSEDFSFYGFPFGNSSDVPAPADYDGDGKSDPAVFRSGTWYILRSLDGGVMSSTFGVAGDKPVPADYDGDGKADIGVYRPNGGTGGEWWIMRSNAGLLAASFGSSTDRTAVGDWTGDGKADCAFYRPSNGTWYVLRSEDMSFFGFPFGSMGDTPAPGDFDGDGKFDAAVFRQPGAQWYVNKSMGGVLSLTFGSGGDQPVPAAFVR